MEDEKFRISLPSPRPDILKTSGRSLNDSYGIERTALLHRQRKQSYAGLRRAISLNVIVPVFGQFHAVRSQKTAG